MHHLVEKEGVRDPVEAVRRGASERVAPILRTALAAGLALIPWRLVQWRNENEPSAVESAR